MLKVINELNSLLEPGIPHCSNDTCFGCHSPLPYQWLNIDRKPLPFALKRVDNFLDKIYRGCKNPRKLSTYKTYKSPLLLSRERGANNHIKNRYLYRGFCSKRCWLLCKKSLDLCLTCNTIITPRILTVGEFTSSLTLQQYCTETREIGRRKNVTFCSRKCKNITEISVKDNNIIHTVSQISMNNVCGLLLRDDDDTKEYSLEGWDTD